MMNNQGPNLVPCGTPAGTEPHSEKQSLLNFTLCVRSVKKFKIKPVILLNRLYVTISEIECDGLLDRTPYENQIGPLL